MPHPGFHYRRCRLRMARGYCLAAGDAAHLAAILEGANTEYMCIYIYLFIHMHVYIYIYIFIDI